MEKEQTQKKLHLHIIHSRSNQALVQWFHIQQFRQAPKMKMETLLQSVKQPNISMRVQESLILMQNPPFQAARRQEWLSQNMLMERQQLEKEKMP